MLSINVNGFVTFALFHSLSILVMLDQFQVCVCYTMYVPVCTHVLS